MILKREGRKMFGEIAVDKGYVTQAQVSEALSIQNKLKKQGINELIGMVMLRNEMLTNEQLIDILKYYETH